MLIACVKTGTKYPDNYVLTLKSMVDRYVDRRVDFVCFTDNPIAGIECEPVPRDLPGWWAKVWLFSLKRPMLYLDLDIVITGPLGNLLDWDGFGIIEDWWLPGYNSSVMRLTGDEGHVWDRFTADVMRNYRMGDQQWVTEQMPNAKTFPAQWLPSYKANKCQENIPDGALAVVFHGNPKPSHIASGWVPEHWR